MLRHLLHAIFACCVMLLQLSCPPSLLANDGDRVLIRAQHIYTSTGDVISPGEVLVTNGKISFVGTAIELALPTEVVEVDTLIPGLINTSSRAGLSGGEAEVSREITPDFSTVSAINWESRDFLEALSEGVTTLQVLPATESVFCGYACVVKSAGSEPIVAPEHALLLAICSDPTSRNRSRTRPDSIYVRQPTNRMGVVWIARNALHQASTGGTVSAADAETMQILEKIVQGKTPVLSVSRADFDIRSALELGELHGFTPTIYGGDEVYRMLDEFSASGASVVFTALTTSSSRSGLRGSEGTELRWNIPGQLQEAKIPFCLAGEQLLDQARFAVRFGLSQEHALQAVTLWPARILGMENELGSIEVGKQADLVALSGPPMKPTSNVDWTMIAGKIYGQGEK